MEIIGNDTVSTVVEDSAAAKTILGNLINGVKNFVQDASDKNAMHKVPYYEKMGYDKKTFEKATLKKLMPVARRWAVTRINNGEDFGDFEDDVFQIDSIEVKLYAKMKFTFLESVRVHGYDHKDAAFVAEMHAMEDFDRNDYSKLLGRMRKSYAKEKSRSLEYLISKTTEFVRKVNDVGRAAFSMLMEGKQLDFEQWSAEQALQNAVFEENKQFLKQTIKHLESMKRNKVKLGVSEIRLLLNQKDGCRREKLYHAAEEWIISIYNSLPCVTADEKAAQGQIYKEICAFVYDVIPLTGRISINMINFIFDRGFLSPMSRSLLLKIQPRINSLSMTPLFHYPLERMLKKVYENYLDGVFTQSDYCVVQVALAYEPKLVNKELRNRYESYLPGNDFAM